MKYFKNIFICFLLSILLFHSQQLIAKMDLINSSSSLLSIKFIIDQYTIKNSINKKNQTYQEIVYPGKSKIAPGKPNLPVFNQWILVPNGTKPTINVTYEDYEIKDNIKIEPSQPPLSNATKANIPAYTKDEVIYSQNEFFPVSQAFIGDIKTKRGQQCSILQIAPFSYNPVTKQLKVYKELTINVSFIGTIEAIPANLYNADLENQLSRMAVNSGVVLKAEKSLLRSNKNFRTDGYDLIIFYANQNFVNPINELLTWKRKKGIKTQSVNVSGMTNEQIENYIDDAYINWNSAPSYLLFFGDIIDNSNMPTWYVNEHPNGGDQGYTGSDFYYADYEDDYVADMGYGRIPVDTESQADSIVARIIRYEANPTQLSHYYHDIDLSCGFQDENHDGYADRRFAKTTEDICLYLNDSGYSTARWYNTVPYNDTNINPTHWSTNPDYLFENEEPGVEIPSWLQKPNFSWNYTQENINNSLNSGRFLFINIDHGSKIKLVSPEYDIGHINCLDNSCYLPINWFVDCETGWFDNETDWGICNTGYTNICLAEQFIRYQHGGAIGVIASSRVSYCENNDRLAYGLMNAIWPDFLSFHGADPFSGGSYYGETPIYTMSNVLNYANQYMMSKYSLDIYTKTAIEEYHWFGDPTMEIWTDVPNSFTSIENLNVLTAETAELQVQVQPAVENAKVTLFNQNHPDVVINGYTNGSGIATINIPENTPVGTNNTIYLTATKHNYRPISETVPAYQGVGGTITTNTVWGPGKVCVLDDVTVGDGVTLTIEPGTTVEFQGHYKIDAIGRILAVGEENNMINFTINNATGFELNDTYDGAWDGIKMGNYAHPDSSFFVYNNFEYIKPFFSSNCFGNGLILKKTRVSNSLFHNIKVRYDRTPIILNLQCNFNNNKVFDNIITGTLGTEDCLVLSWSPGNKIDSNIFENNIAGACINGTGVVKNNDITQFPIYLHLGGTIKNNRIHNCSTGIESGMCDCNIIGNYIYNNYVGVHIDGGGHLENNIIMNNNYGVLWSQMQGGGRYEDFSNNVIYNNNYGVKMMYIFDSIEVKNNIIRNNQYYQFLLDNYGDELSCPNFIYNNIQGNLDDFILNNGFVFSGEYENNIDVNPLIVNPSDGIGTDFNGYDNTDWSLQSSSPCINAGDPNTDISQFPTDMSNNERIYNGRIDIGAYEYQDEGSSYTNFIPENNTASWNFPNSLASIQFVENHYETSLSVSKFNTNPGIINSLPAGILSLSKDCYWEVISANGNVGEYNITLNLSEVNNIYNFNTLKILKRDNAISEWIDVESLGANLYYNEPFITVEGLNNFSQFGVGGENDNTLPVTLSSFTAVPNNDNISLNWRTESEHNNVGWNIYRSENENGLDNEEILMVNYDIIPGMGAVSTPTEYTYADEIPFSNNRTYYYWLESISFTSETKFYGPVNITVPEGGFENQTPELPFNYGLHQNYPNPFNPTTEISFVLKKDEKVKLDIFNVKGEKVITLINESLFKKDKFHSINWNSNDSRGKKVGSGIYFYRLKHNNQYEIKKMILLK